MTNKNQTASPAKKPGPAARASTNSTNSTNSNAVVANDGELSPTELDAVVGGVGQASNGKRGGVADDGV